MKIDSPCFSFNARWREEERVLLNQYFVEGQENKDI